MPFPVTARYFLDFRNSDTGLTPTFTFFQQTPGFGATSPSSPAGGIVEKSNGRYYFDWIWLTKADSDIVFQVDGGASIPTEEVRYIKGTISPRDRFLDEPVSQVVSDVWTDSTAYTTGQKGKRVDDIGAAADTSATASLFGKTLLYKESVRGDSAGSSDGNSVKQVYDRVGAPVGASISADIAAVQATANTVNTKIGTPVGTVSTDIAGVQTTANTVNSKIGTPVGTVSTDIAAVKAVVDTINLETDPAAVADAVWDALTTGNITVGTMGGLLNTAATAAAAAPSAATIADVVWDEALSGHAIAGSAGKKLTDGALTADVTASTAAILAAINPKLDRALGLMHENSYLDQTIFDGSNNMTSGRFRIYDSKANALAAGVTGLVATYTITASYVGENVQTYSVVIEP